MQMNSHWPLYRDTVEEARRFPNRKYGLEDPDPKERLRLEC